MGRIYLIFIWRTLAANFRPKKALCSGPLDVKIKNTVQGNVVDSTENSVVTKALRALLLQTFCVSHVGPSAPVKVH